MSYMATIDKLIHDRLVARHGVVLPGAGTLQVRRRGAKRLSETQIMPPQNVVVFVPDELEGTDSVPSLIAAGGSVGVEEADAMYGSWLEAARRDDGTIAIEGVGEVTSAGFVVDRSLHVALNPSNNEDIVTMETARSSTPLWAWIVIGALGALLVAGAVVCWTQGVFSCGAGEPEVVVAVPAAEPEAEESAVEATPAAVPTTPAGPRFHVIAGAFAVESNADNFVARLKREHPELTPEKVLNPRTGYNMVSIFQMPTRRDAQKKMNLYWDIDLSLWIYEEK